MKTFAICLGLCVTLLFTHGACSSKMSSNRIDTLEGRKDLLEKSTKLNNLKLALEKNQLRQTELSQEVEQINQEASRSAHEADELSTRVSRNPGDAGLAKRANRASQKAAKDAQKARKLNGQLEDINGNIRDLQKDIKKTEEQLNELKGKVEFVPNN